MVLRVFGDALEIGAQQRLAAGEDEQRRGIEREDLAGDAEALRRRQLTRRRLVWARLDIAVGTLEIAAAREIPRDHVWHVFARRLELRRLRPSKVYRGCPRKLLHVIPRARSDRGICFCGFATSRSLVASLLGMTPRVSFAAIPLRLPLRLVALLTSNQPDISLPFARRREWGSA